MAMLAVGSLLATAIGAGVSAYGAKQQGIAESNQANYQAAVARNNQIVANQYATTELQRGQVLEGEKREQTAQTISNIRAAVGASGLDVASGSALRLQSDTAKVGELDAQTIRNNSQRAAYGYQVQGMNYGATAGLEDAEARNAARSGNLGMWSSIIGGASTVANRWANFANAGVFSGGTGGDSGMGPG